MRVLIIHTYYKHKGGEDSVVINEMELLKSHGIEVELLSFNNDHHAMAKLLLLPFNYAAYTRVKQKIRSFKPDVVHLHNLHFAATAAVIYAVKQFKLPLVYTLHNYRLLCPSGTLFHQDQIFMASIDQKFPWNAVKNKVYHHSYFITFWVAFSMFIHQILGTWAAVSRFIVLGEHSRELFVQSKMAPYADRFVVKPNFCYALLEGTGVKGELEGNGVNGELTWNGVNIESNGLNNKGYYLYVGRLSEEKGIDTLLEAFADSTLPLKIAGSGPLLELVRNYASCYTNISFVGEMSKEGVYHLMKNAAALIFPSIWYETFGMTLIEAFSMGTPVIASDLGNLKNMVHNGYNGLRFEAGNSEDLNTKLAFYESISEIERAGYRRNSFKTYQENYAPEKNAALLIDIYQSVCAHPPAD